jgi:uncharacterized protein YjbJ (UPF0337 family)
LTENQLDQINGSYERLVGVIQENYGIAREKAQEQVNGFVDGLKNTFGGQS